MLSLPNIANLVFSKIKPAKPITINTLINGCAQVFVDREEDFLAGTFDKALMDALNPDIVAHMQKISDISVKRIYNAPTVVQIEIAGFKVMNALLEEFVPAYLKTNKSMFDKKLVAMMPEMRDLRATSTMSSRSATVRSGAIVFRGGVGTCK